MSSLLTAPIERRVDQLLAGKTDIVDDEAAAAFVVENPELCSLYVKDAVRKAIVAAIDRRSDRSAQPHSQPVLFAFTGIPEALYLGDGVHRPRSRCTRADLVAGRDAVKARLKAFDEDMKRLDPFMTTDDTTVAEAVHELERAMTEAQAEDGQRELHLVGKTG